MTEPLKIFYFSDLHLDYDNHPLPPTGIDIILIAGDFADDFDTSSKYLAELNKLNKPIFFVLGNHDYYGDTIENRRKMWREFVKDKPNLHYLEKNTESINIGDKNIVISGCTLWGKYKQDETIMTLSFVCLIVALFIIYYGMRRSWLICGGLSVLLFLLILHIQSVIADKPDIGSIKNLDYEKERENSINWLKNEINTKKPDIVLTHFSPSLNYNDSGDLKPNTTFPTNFSYWIHGHYHEEINKGKIRCNAFFENKNYNPNAIIEL